MCFNILCDKRHNYHSFVFRDRCDDQTRNGTENETNKKFKRFKKEKIRNSIKMSEKNNNLENETIFFLKSKN